MLEKHSLLVPCLTETAQETPGELRASRPLLSHTVDTHSISLGTRRQTHGTGLMLTDLLGHSSISVQAHLYL